MKKIKMYQLKKVQYLEINKLIFNVNCFNSRYKKNSSDYYVDKYYIN